VTEPIAIVGIACRFPGAQSPAELWRLLATGQEAIGDVPPDRFDAASLYDPRIGLPGRIASRRGGFLPDIDRFDAAFFGMSPREAERLDPQQRLLLELSWEALEVGGLVSERLAGSSTGVFVGMWLSDYEARLFAEPSLVDFHMTTGSGRYSASGRLSHVFGFHGPSLTLDTACSSSLVAVHLACQSLRSGECSLALAAGVNVILQPQITIAYSQSRMMAPDGRCKFGDAGADGYVRSEGAGVVVLKPLDRALADGDRIRAVILGSAVNNDGGSGGSLGTPGRAGQEDLLRRAYRATPILPADVDYVEVHGTGTVAGDPVELRALAKVLGEGRPAERPLVVGSVKTNIGHTEGAAGMAGLIKTVLALEHRAIPASLHLNTPNPALAWDRVPIVVQRALGPWPSTGRPPRAAVSSFGIAGTNSHVVLEGPPASSTTRPTAPAGRAHVLALSARAERALVDLAAAYRDALRTPDALDLNDVCYTASVRRDHHPHRLAVVGRDAAAVADQLGQFVEAHESARVSHVPVADVLRVVFVFPGQGSQWFGMGRQLYRDEPVFRDALAHCDRAIAKVVGWSVLGELLTAEDSGRGGRVEFVQPLLFAVQVALAALWRSWGIEPAAVVGHSMGEVAAAHVAGALSLDDAARVIGERSRLLQRVSGRGSMALVELSMDAAQAALAGHEQSLSIAVSNSARSTVIAGDNAALDDVLAMLERRGVFCRRVKVDVASHSPQVDPLLADLVATLTGTVGHAAGVPMYSTVTCQPVAGEALDAAYWVRNLREPVRFAATLRRLVADGHNAFLEISPHPLLVPAIQEDLGASGAATVVAASLRRDVDEQAAMLQSLGQLYAGGAAVRWTALYPDGRCVLLPAYQWQRERFWYEGDCGPASPSGRRARAGHPLLGEHVWSSIDPTMVFWETEVDAGLPWLAQHRVDGTAVLPAAAMMEAVLAGAAAAFEPRAWRIGDTSFHVPFVLVGDRPRTIQLVMNLVGPGSLSFRLSSREPGTVADRGEWTVHVEGNASLAGESAPSHLPLDLDDPIDATELSGEDHYAAMSRRGLEYGPAFRGVQRVRLREGRVVARLRVQDAPRPASAPSAIYPGLLDAAFQCLVAALPERESPYVPVGVASLWVVPAVGGADLRCDALLRTMADDGATAVGDVVVTDANGDVIVEARNLRLALLARSATHGPGALLYQIDWVAKSRSDAASDRTRPGAWLVLADRGGAGDDVAAALGATGHTVMVVPAPDDSGPSGPLAYERILLDAEQRHGRCRGIIHARALDVPASSEDDGALSHARDLGCDSVVSLVQALIGHRSPTPASLWLLTAGAVVVPGDVGDPALLQSPLWGLGSVIRSEHPELACRNVDLSARPTSAEIKALALECQHADREDRLAFRGDERFVARLGRAAEASAAPARPADGAPFQAEIVSAGTLDSLVLRRCQRAKPGPGQVEIEVAAVGLNFMNVMSALGVYPGYERGVGPLGIECSGRVVAVGAGVYTAEVGDDVVGIAFDCLATHAIADARLVVRKPASLSYESAASLPIVFLTARYALEHLARLGRGERVLIHAAAGGVGLAAVQVARRLGAIVLGTAGSIEKREYLVRQGVASVFDSRSLQFAADVMQVTEGAGVDVVLNSLAGPAIAASLSTLAPYGRFVEIGKRDIYENTRLGLAPFRSNLAYFALDLERMATERPDFVGALLADVVSQVASGELEPLPVRVFPVTELGEAFRHMAQARHTGKIVISLAPAVTRTATVAPAALPVRADGTYLITGGLGALGLEVARWLVNAGARHLVLVGRGPAGESARAALEQLRAQGAEVSTVSADVANASQLTAALDLARREGLPLRGVVHAAGRLDDATLLQFQSRHWTAVWPPKVVGAWNLHRLTEHDPLDFFVLFSSVSAFLGLSGQANYAAANAFLDALATARRVAGKVALSIGWGPWADIGLAAESTRRGARLAAAGLGSVSPAQGIAALAHVIGSRQGHVSIMRFDPDTWYRDAPPAFAEKLLHGAGGRAVTPGEPSIGGAVRESSWDTARKILEEYLVEQASRVLGLDRSRIDIGVPLKNLGLDSLMALELRHRLEVGLGIPLSATLVWNHPTVSAIVEFLQVSLGVRRDDDQPSPGTGPTERRDPALREGGDQGTADIEALMAAELARIDRLLSTERDPR
jgi:acyl transferase domain-containing protein/acyl carrier protein